MDNASYKASIKNIQNLTYISKERIRRELLKLLASQFAKEVMIKLVDENIFHYIGLPSITISSKLLQKISFKIDDSLVNLATLCNLSTTQNANKVTQLSAYLQTLPKTRQ